MTKTSPYLQGSPNFIFHIPLQEFEKHFSSPFAYRAYHEHSDHAQDVQYTRSIASNTFASSSEALEAPTTPASASMASTTSSMTNQISDLTNLAGQISGLLDPSTAAQAGIGTALSLLSKATGPGATLGEIIGLAGAFYILIELYNTNASSNQNIKVIITLIVIAAVAALSLFKGVGEPVVTKLIDAKTKNQLNLLAKNKTLLLHSAIFSALYNFLKGKDQTRLTKFLEEVLSTLTTDSKDVAKHFPKVLSELMKFTTKILNWIPLLEKMGVKILGSAVGGSAILGDLLKIGGLAASVIPFAGASHHEEEGFIPNPESWVNKYFKAESKEKASLVSLQPLPFVPLPPPESSSSSQSHAMDQESDPNLDKDPVNKSVEEFNTHLNAFFEDLNSALVALRNNLHELGGSEIVHKIANQQARNIVYLQSASDNV